MHKRFALYVTLAAMFLLAVAPTVWAQYTPDVFVLDQPIVDGNVTVSRVTTNGPGWIVIHADSEGAPGPVIGQSQLVDGVNAQVAVAVDVDAATETLYAMLHVDEGEVGTYEFPDGPDVPLLVDDQVITPPFQITSIESTIVEVAANAGTFNTLLVAAEAAGLVDALRGDGPLTVFAPSDDVFDALPEGTVEAWLDQPETLAQVLQHHIVPGLLLSSDLEDGSELTSLAEQPLPVTFDGDEILIDFVAIVTPDIEAFNGVIHVIDSILIPPSMEEEAVEAEAEEEAATEEATEEESEEAMAEVLDIVDTAVAAGNFGTLAAALEATDLIETLKSEGPFTVFAPTDDAFGDLPEGTLEALLNEPETLSQILLYHVVPGVVLSADLSNGLEAETAQGGTVIFSFDDDGNAVVNDAAIIAADIEASNGVIHVIDKVILPDLGAGEEAAEEATEEPEAEEPAEEEDATEESPAEEEAAEESTDEAMMDDLADIVDTAIAADDFELLVAAVDAAGLVETLKSEGPFTVFAPTDEAFANLPEGTLEALLEDPESLAQILLYHVVPGKVLAADLSDGMEAGTAQGATVTITLDGGAMVNDANIIATDIQASNGVIHIIDAVILPPAEEEMAEEEMTEEEMTEEEPAEEEMTEEEMVENEEPTTMPETGGDMGSVAMTIFAVLMTMLTVVGLSFADKRRNMNI